MKETIFMKNNVNSNVIHKMFNFKENFKSNVTKFKRILNWIEEEKRNNHQKKIEREWQLKWEKLIISDSFQNLPTINETNQTNWSKF